MEKLIAKLGLITTMVFSLSACNLTYKDNYVLPENNYNYHEKLFTEQFFDYVVIPYSAEAVRLSVYNNVTGQWDVFNENHEGYDNEYKGIKYTAFLVGIAQMVTLPNDHTAYWKPGETSGYFARFKTEYYSAGQWRVPLSLDANKYKNNQQCGNYSEPIDVLVNCTSERIGDNHIYTYDYK